MQNNRLSQHRKINLNQRLAPRYNTNDRFPIQSNLVKCTYCGYKFSINKKFRTEIITCPYCKNKQY